MPSATDEQPFLLADLPPTQGQSRLALAIVAATVAAFVLAVPFAYTPLPRVDAFIPIYTTAFLMSDFGTAVLLLAQYSVVSRRPLLMLANGYLFSALIVIPYALTFPGSFAPAGLLGAGLQSTAWLYAFWHLGLPLSVIAYGRAKGTNGRTSASQGSVRADIGLSVAGVIALVCALTWFVIVQHDFMPELFADGIHLNLLTSFISVFYLLLGTVALAVLWIRKHSVLDRWLMVAIVAWMIEISLQGLLPTDRFSLGWYMGRAFSLIAGSVVLVMLLSETTTLNMHLARLAMTKRGAREARKIGMDAMSISIAHEIRQPLTAISTNAGAGLRWLANLEKDPSAVDEVRSAMERIVRNSERAADVMTNVRRMFKNEAHETALLDVNDLVREVLATLDLDMQSQQVSVSTQLANGVPMIPGNRGQLQQVFLNLIANAIEAMGTSRVRMLRVSSDTIQRSSGVMVTIEDSGTGIKYEDKERIFEPFFTTKTGGTGIGLAICRSIVEAHGGTLAAFANKPCGTIFRVALPDQ